MISSERTLWTGTPSSTSFNHLQSTGFRDIAGARGWRPTCRSRQRLINEVVAASIPPNVPVREVSIRPEAGDRFSVRITPRASLLPAVTLRLEIERQPEFPSFPVLVHADEDHGRAVRVCQRRAADRQRCCLPACARRRADPGGSAALAASSGLGRVLQYVRRVEVHSEDGRVTPAARRRPAVKLTITGQADSTALAPCAPLSSPASSPRLRLRRHSRNNPLPSSAPASTSSCSTSPSSIEDRRPVRGLQAGGLHHPRGRQAAADRLVRGAGFARARRITRAVDARGRARRPHQRRRRSPHRLARSSMMRLSVSGIRENVQDDRPHDRRSARRRPTRWPSSSPATTRSRRSSPTTALCCARRSNAMSIRRSAVGRDAVPEHDSDGTARHAESAGAAEPAKAMIFVSPLAVNPADPNSDLGLQLSARAAAGAARQRDDLSDQSRRPRGAVVGGAAAPEPAGRTLASSVDAGPDPAGDTARDHGGRDRRLRGHRTATRSTRRSGRSSARPAPITWSGSESQHTDGKFRRIEVRTNREGLTVRTRNGYNAAKAEKDRKSEKASGPAAPGQSARQRAAKPRRADARRRRAVRGGRRATVRS